MLKTPDSTVSLRVVLLSLNVIVSALSESYPRGICVGFARLYLNDVPLSVTVGTTTGTTFSKSIIIVVGWSIVMLSS